MLSKFYAKVMGLFGFGKKNIATDEKPSGFTERGSYRYDHPSRSLAIRRFIDPLVAVRRLAEHGDGNNWTEALTAFEVACVAIKSGNEKLFAKGIEERDKAVAELALLARRVFDLPTVEEYGEALGWTEAEAFLLLADFIRDANEVGNQLLPLAK